MGIFIFHTQILIRFYQPGLRVPIAMLIPFQSFSPPKKEALLLPILNAGTPHLSRRGALRCRSSARFFASSDLASPPFMAQCSASPLPRDLSSLSRPLRRLAGRHHRLHHEFSLSWLPIYLSVVFPDFLQDLGACPATVDLKTSDCSSLLPTIILSSAKARKM
ncbi:hypothetical protein VPH35_125099 [Triticum aestivum]